MHHDFDIATAKEFLSAYESEGMGADRNAGFLRSLILSNRPPRGGGIGWYSDIIDRGKPGTTDVSHILAAADAAPREEDAATLRDFANRLRRNERLSERQDAFLAGLLERSGRPIVLSESSDDEEFVKGAANHFRYSSSPFYWARKPGTHNRLKGIFDRVKHGGRLEKSDVEYVKATHKGLHAEWMKARALEIGDTVSWVITSGITGNTEHHTAIMIDTAKFDERGIIRLPVCGQDGKTDVNARSIIKRLPRRKQ